MYKIMRLLCIGVPMMTHLLPKCLSCMAHENTQENALKNINEAMHLWIDMAREHSDPIPEPRCHHLMYA